ncbi:MAG: hypothetical protein NVS1B14_12240 [Vulcanimicrobiaceae bacterium]
MSNVELLVLIACAAGACTDIARKRIPNVLTFTTAALALAIHAAAGLSSLAVALLVMTVVAAGGLFLFSFRWIGGGDVKLIAAVAGAVSFPDCIGFVLYTMLAGGVLSIAVALARGTLKQSFAGAFIVAHPLLYRATPVALPATTKKMPYGVAIFIGAALIVLSHSVAPFLRLPIF